ncbi:MAG: TetR family transcriptional regulator [Acidimicrobiales bacterium]
MSHRERLLAAARRCLVTRGYARTTARDLVAESDTNLASIGYHFGSKDELLTQALVLTQAEYVEKVMAVVAQAAGGPHRREQRRDAWVEMVAKFGDERPLSIAFFEALVEAQRTPELRAALAESYRAMRERIAESLGSSFSSDEERDAAAAYVIAVSDGLIIQHLLDPDATPSGDTVFDAAERYHAPARSRTPRT